MQPSDVYSLLTRRIRRGLIVFSILRFASIGAAVWALVTPGNRPWGVSAFLLSILFHLGGNTVWKQNVSAWKISGDPGLVYWAHPNDLRQPCSPSATIKFRFLTLHLRDGQQFEVNLPPAEMQIFMKWLNERNPTMRWGAFDAEPGEPGGRNT
jgi:hypothetical protein